MIKDNSKKSVLPRILMCLLVIILVMYFISIIAGYSPFYNNSAEKNAIVEINKDNIKIEQLINERYDDLTEVKDSIIDKSSHNAIVNVLNTYIGSEQFGDLRFFSNGKIYDANGLEVANEYAEIKAFEGLNRRAFSGEYIDNMLSKSCVAFYIPITGSADISGLVSIIEARNFINLEGVLNENSKALSIITDGGVNLCDKVKDGYNETIGNNYFNFIERITQEKEITQKIVSLMTSGKTGATHIKINGEKHIVAIKPIASADNKLYAVSLSKSESLMVIEMSYLRQIISLIFIAVLSLVVSLVYAWLYHKHSKKKIRNLNYTHTNLECPNIEQLKLDMANTFSYTPLMIKKYSVVAFKLRRFSSISKVFEEKDVDELLRQGAKIFAGVCSYDESYAYLGEGTFGMLIKYTDENSFAKRISMIKGILAKNPFALSKGLTLRFRVGVCHAFGATRTNAAEMIENAITACKIANERTNAPFIVFDKKINEEVARNEKIESMMEDGLRNGDFKLFLQPKYNIKSDRIDSAEALVRWFDRERADYIFPAEFISLFETNGFIVKLDHYIYLEVLQYFKSAVERGEKVVPISVNVSRVTISSPDFLDFYINNKRKFGIGDNFIMLELTESFALDDNNSIKEIVAELHKNGIKCSLDDFGSGFSSFNVLKSIPFDELKLDRCFIEKTDQPEKDEIVLKMVIEMAKALKITIVQEGVETKEMLEKITKYGCDVAQGYYYAKAISLEEYRVFLKTNTSIEFKSRVK
ncbi:MAG: EAL domain-containing protein [Clostridia bacterium]|nr:EAL domain-containing protein [Clostridia bacterium]